MDPNEALRQWQDAIAIGDLTRAMFSAGNLCGWLANGGMAPAWTPEVRAEFFAWVDGRADDCRTPVVHIVQDGKTLCGIVWSETPRLLRSGYWVESADELPRNEAQQAGLQCCQNCWMTPA